VSLFLPWHFLFPPRCETLAIYTCPLWPWRLYGVYSVSLGIQQTL
jgi:hypothetical protein